MGGHMTTFCRSPSPSQEVSGQLHIWLVHKTLEGLENTSEVMGCHLGEGSGDGICMLESCFSDCNKFTQDVVTPELVALKCQFTMMGAFCCSFVRC